jgi:hypothetical protein
MIRHVVVCEFRDDASPQLVEEFLATIGGVRTEGLRSLTFGTDLGLRSGNANYALVADFDDAEAYQRFDEDPEHQRIRALIGPVVVSATRVQFAFCD